MPPKDPLARPDFEAVRQLGLKGLNLLLDPQDITANESPDMRNIAFDGGMIGPRNGTTLKLAKPTGETADPLHMMKAKDSRGTEYLIAIFGVNFYLLDTTLNTWIKLNGAYSPASTTLKYDYANWNKGTALDSFYFGNGTDDTMKWNQCLSHATIAPGAADVTITVSDAAGFPASGTLVVQDTDGTRVTVAYTGIAGNVITLAGAFGSTFHIGCAVTVVIQDMTGMPKGAIFAASAPQCGARLFIANNLGNETKVYFSKSTDQEDFNTTADATTGGVQYVIDGEGPIVDLVDFGTYLMVVKKNAFTNMYASINTTLNTLTMITSPLVYGESIEPVSHASAITIENAYIYATKTQGVYQLVPSSTGSSTSTPNNPFSDQLYALFIDPNFSFAAAHTEFFRRKLYLLASNIAGVNNLLLVRDFLYGGWTVWDNINAADMYDANGVLYFLCQDDGGLYYLDTTSYQDFRSGQAIGYTTYAFSKRFDFGEPSWPKQQRYAMLQGYISQNTKLYVDVLFNENGLLAGATYLIDGSNTDYVSQVPLFGIGRTSIGLNPIGGSQKGTIGVFRVYLDLLYGVGAHVIQFKVYTINPGDNFGLTGLSVDPEEIHNVPSQLVLGIA